MDSAADFSAAYREAVGEIMLRMPEDWSAIAKHNIAWGREHFDARKYLRDSEVRYQRVFKALISDGSEKILDVGGFLAAFPLTLTKLGLNVSIAEKFGYYDHSLDEIAEYLKSNGIEVIDADFTDAALNPATFAASYDAITCMAVAEHLAHSPRALMENINRALKPGGTLLFEVPNLAFWPRRFIFFFRGTSVLAPIEDVYQSAVPFTGHHREYTLDDARYVVTQGGFSIRSEETFNYAIDRSRWWNLVKFAPAFLFKEWAEVILLHCHKQQAR